MLDVELHLAVHKSFLSTPLNIIHRMKNICLAILATGNNQVSIQRNINESNATHKNEGRSAPDIGSGASAVYSCIFFPIFEGFNFGFNLMEITGVNVSILLDLTRNNLT